MLRWACQARPRLFCPAVLARMQPAKSRLLGHGNRPAPRAKPLRLQCFQSQPSVWTSDAQNSLELHGNSILNPIRTPRRNRWRFAGMHPTDPRRRILASFPCDFAQRALSPASQVHWTWDVIRSTDKALLRDLAYNSTAKSGGEDGSWTPTTTDCDVRFGPGSPSTLRPSHLPCLSSWLVAASGQDI